MVEGPDCCSPSFIRNNSMECMFDRLGQIPVSLIQQRRYILLSILGIMLLNMNEREQLHTIDYVLKFCQCSIIGRHS